MHLNRIIAGLKMYGPFRNLHRKNGENFIMTVIHWEFFYS
jgi:hypothetical protein